MLDLCIPFLEGTLWLVQGILYYEDKRGRQKKLGRPKSPHVNAKN